LQDLEVGLLLVVNAAYVRFDIKRLMLLNKQMLKIIRLRSFIIRLHLIDSDLEKLLKNIMII
jgi:hypothetical protein